MKIVFLRINASDNIIVTELNLLNQRFLIEVDGFQIDLLDKSNAVWYRRGFLNFFNTIDKRQTYLNHFGKEENSSLNQYFFSILLKNNTKCIGNFLLSSPNKLLVTTYAQKCGLLVPPTIVTNKIETAIVFVKNNKSAITKGIQAAYLHKTKKHMVAGYTSKIDLKDIQEFNGNLIPSLIQTEIEKKFEIRSFFLNDEFYSMAIFSQKNPKTIVDFRNYDYAHPNRTVPYTLPKIIEQKLKRLYKILCLNSGSTDLIVDKEDNYYFLEVNPVGQFGMVSKPCNYNLEKLIAFQLFKYEKNKE